MRYKIICVEITTDVDGVYDFAAKDEYHTGSDRLMGIKPVSTTTERASENRAI